MNPLRAFHPKFLLLLLAGLWLVGCTSTQKSGVVVTLVTVEATDVSLQNNTVVLQLRLQNENLMAFAISKTEYKVYLNEVYFGTARGSKPVGLMERGDVRTEATLELANAETATRLRAMLQAGAVNYRLETRLICDAGEEEIRLISTNSGRINAR